MGVAGHGRVAADALRCGRACFSGGQDFPYFLFIYLFMLTSNRCRLPSNCHWLPFNRRRLPPNRHQLPSNSHRLPRNCHRLRSSRRQLPSNRRRLPSNCRRLPSNRRRLPLRCPWFMALNPPFLRELTTYSNVVERLCVFGGAEKVGLVCWLSFLRHSGQAPTHSKNCTTAQSKEQQQPTYPQPPPPPPLPFVWGWGWVNSPRHPPPHPCVEDSLLKRQRHTYPWTHQPASSHPPPPHSPSKNS